MPATYEKIATTTLGSANSTITFSSIAASWTDLKMIFTGTNTAAGQDLLLRFNGDSGTNYSYTVLYGNGSSALSSRNTSLTYIFVAGVQNLSTTIPQFCDIDIFSYTGSTNKTIMSAHSADLNGSGTASKIVGLWRNTAAITSVSLSTSGTTFTAGTTATLYGILKA